MREVDYKVQKGTFTNRIYAGTVHKDKDGITTWRTRGDVTQLAIEAVIEHYIEVFKKENPKKGLRWNFGREDEDFTVELRIRKKGDDE